MSLDQLGETGLPGAQGLPYLTLEELNTLREELALLPFQIDEMLLEGIAHITYQIRGWDKMRGDAEPSMRALNLRRCLKLARSGHGRKAMSNLTSKNQYDVAIQTPKGSKLSLPEAIERVLQNLPQRGRGQSRANGPHAAAVLLADLLRNQKRPLSSTKGGPFVNLLGIVFSIARRKHIASLHNLAEKALRNRAAFSNGLMIIPSRQ